MAILCRAAKNSLRGTAMLLENSCHCCEERTTTNAMMNSPACWLTSSKHIFHAAEEQLPLLRGENSHKCHDELSCVLTSSKHICHAAGKQLPLLRGENNHKCHDELSCVLTSSRHICHAAGKQLPLLGGDSKHICHAAEEQLSLMRGENSHNCHDDELSCSRHICHAVWRFLRPICMCVKAGRDILSRRCIWHGGDWRRATRRRSKIFPYLPIGGGGEEGGGGGGGGSADMQAGFQFSPWIITLLYLHTRM